MCRFSRRVSCLVADQRTRICRRRLKDPRSTVLSPEPAHRSRDLWVVAFRDVTRLQDDEGYR